MANNEKTYQAILHGNLSWDYGKKLVILLFSYYNLDYFGSGGVYEYTAGKYWSLNLLHWKEKKKPVLLVMEFCK